MAVRKPSIKTQLKNANIELAAAHQKIGQLTKDVEQKDSYYKNSSARAEKAEKEIADLQTFLDNLPGSIEKRKDGEYSDRPVMMRLAAWFATRGSQA